MNWTLILQFFACGFALVAGVFGGAAAMALAIRRSDKKRNDELAALNNRIEDRLAKYVEHSERMAKALEALPLILMAHAVIAGRERDGDYDLLCERDQDTAASMAKGLLRPLQKKGGS